MKTHLAKLLVSACAAFFFYAETAFSLDGGALGSTVKPRVFITTDISSHGDADDHQSLVSALLFADVLDIEGIDGDKPSVEAVIKAYEADYANLKTWGDYPTPAYLRSIVGGSALIKAAAKKVDPRPLWVITWGGMGSVRDALACSPWGCNNPEPAIRSKFRIISIAVQDVQSHEQLRKEFPDLWWIENLRSFPAMYGISDKAWMNTNIRNHGAMGIFYAQKTDACSYCNGIREGDSPTFLYLLRGNLDNPDSDHWGGRFLKTTKGPNRWEDDGSANYGTQQILKWKAEILAEYAKRFDRAAKTAPVTAVQNGGALQTGNKASVQQLYITGQYGVGLLFKNRAGGSVTLSGQRMERFAPGGSQQGKSMCLPVGF